MTNDAEFRVLPREPNYRKVEVTKDEKANVQGLGGGLGCFTWGGIFLAAYFIIAFMGIAAFGAEDGSSLAPLAMLLAIVVASFGVTSITSTIRRNRIERLEREKNETARKAELDRVANDATSLTSRVARNYQSSIQLTNEVPNHLAEAGSWLKNAEAEFTSNAYGPFWDAVENAALHLSALHDKTNQLARNADEYYQSLNERQHNFPTFPIRPTNLPATSPVVDDLRRIVRMGQTNFEFANIWEHRRTREVLIAGFQTLGEAVSNLGSVIDNSLYNLQQSVSSDMARVVEEQITSRESLDHRMLEQNRMIDNIQHHRTPGVSDTPQK